MESEKRALIIAADCPLITNLLEEMRKSGYAVDFISNKNLVDSQSVEDAAKGISQKYDKIVIDLFTSREYAEKNIEQLTERQWRAYKYNAVSYMYDIGRYILKSQILQGLDILILTSAAGHTPVRGNMLIGGGDAAAVMFAKVMAVELAPKGVSVNCAAIGYDGQDGICAENETALLEHIPTKRALDISKLAHELARMCMSEKYAATGNVYRMDDAFCLAYMRDY